MTRAVLVTGGAGFVGRHVVRKFINAGWSTFVVDRRPPDRELQSIGLVGYKIADIMDGDSLAEIMSSNGITDLVHCAGIVGPGPSSADPAAAISVNAIGTLRIATAAANAGVRLTYLSTATLYGHSEQLLLSESDLPEPVGFYDGTKLMGEIVVETLRRNEGLDSVILRPSFVYGPGSAIGEYYIPRALAGEAIYRQTGSDHPCEFTYVLDLVEAIFLSHTQRPGAPRIFNISSGELRTLGDLANVVKSYLPEAIIEIGPGIDPKRHLRPRMSLEAAEKFLGYTPKYRLEDGVRDWLAQERAASVASA